MTVKFCILAALLAVFVTKAFSLKCFQCNSYKDPACSDLTSNETNSVYYKTCEIEGQNDVFCRKTVQKILDGDQPPRITRGCGWILHKEKKDNCRLADTDFKLEKSCQCFSDGCNGVGNKQISIFTIISILTTKFALF